jgi:rod shape determining protein RodA
MFEPILSNKQPRIDKLQLLALFALMALGAAFIYSATMVNESARTAPWHHQLWIRQLFWYATGAGAAVALCMVDYLTLARWAMLAYWGCVLLLLLVLVLGTVHSGARRWFDLGFFSLQPSEFAKLALILGMAHFLSRPAEELRGYGIFARALGMMLLPFALILKEPDLGSALVLLPTGFAMLLVAGAPWKYLVTLIGGVGLLSVVLVADVLFAPPGWWQIKLETYQRQRLLVYFGADFAPANASPEDRAKAKQIERTKSYQVRQALISVGSGGFTGKGWHKGNRTALGFLPPGAAHNDFIFSVLAEEKGFVGSMIVLTLYGVVFFTGIRIAGQARDRLGKLLAVGVVTLLFSHVFINIGMNISIVPVTGIPLPLLSYGGSSVIGSLIAIGLLQNVYIHRKGY